MVYIRRAGPPLEVSQVDSTMPSFSICRSVRYKVPGFIASNPKAAARSISSYPYEPVARPRLNPPELASPALVVNLAFLVVHDSLFHLYVHFTYMYCAVKGAVGHCTEKFLKEEFWFNPRSRTKSRFDA